MAFSDRLGITKAKSILQVESIDTDLRNGLWQTCIESLFHVSGSRHDYEYDQQFRAIMDQTFVYFFKQTSEHVPYGYEAGIKAVRDWFFKAQWWQIYNFLEFLISGFDQPPFVPDHAFSERISFFLEREKSGYRIVDQLFVPITDPVEVLAVSDAASLVTKFAGAREHIRASIALFSKKPKADYRNSIKEAISAVEATARIVTGNPKATLGDALKVLSSKIAIHPAMKDGMNKLYGYTSDEGGIRHALLEESNIDEAEAKFMIVTCSAFVNFCVQRTS
jgi:AbiJ N-terminal domain 4